MPCQPNRGMHNTPRPWRGYWIVGILALLGTGLLNMGAAEPSTQRNLLISLGYEAIALKKTEQGHLVIPVRLNGRKTQCTIDSGFTYSAVDASRAGKLPPLDRRDPGLDLPNAAFRQTNATWVRIGHLDIGSRRLEHVPVQSVDWRTGNRRDWLTRLVEGRQSFDSEVVLGADFLRRFHAVIEFQRIPTLYLREKTMDAANASRLDLALTNAGFLPIRLYHLETLGWVAPATFDGTRVPLLIDTGASHTLLDDGVVQQLGIKPRVSDRQIQGVEGRKTRLMTAQFQEAQIGVFTIPKPVVGVADLSAWNLDRTHRSMFMPRGLIGSTFFSETQAILDCGNQKLWCWPKRR
jgi:predicted aspartyl protease